jgi:hypothetical protein
LRGVDTYYEERRDCITEFRSCIYPSGN